MKKVYLFVFILLSFITFNIQAQIRITSKEAAQHIGDSAVVCDKVFGGRFLERTGITFLNLGDNFPDHLLTVVIRGTDRDKFKFKPEETLKNKRICVTGRISEYAGKPQIVITDPGQIKPGN